MKETNNVTRNQMRTKTIVMMGLFVALSYVVSLLSFPVFPATPYFKLDFGNVFIMLTGFLLGPVHGVIVCVLKEGISILTSGTGGVGELANMLMTCSFILLPSIVYRYKKGFKMVVVTMLGACFIGIVVALLANRFIIFPLYMGEGAAAVFKDVFWFAVAFNAIKTVAISLLTILLYKRLSIFFKMHANTVVAN